MSGTLIDLTLDETEPPNPFTHSNDSDYQDSVQLFQLYAKIVGKSFYRGEINDGEILFLEREPTNYYDSNAIVVKNLENVQVGHISASSQFPNMAAALSPIIDFKLMNSYGGSVEATCVGRKKMCRIIIVGSLAHINLIQEHLQCHCIQFLNMVSNEETDEYIDYLTEYPQARLKQSLTDRSSDDIGKNLANNYQRLSEAEVLRSLDGIWNSHDKELANISLDNQDDYIIESYFNIKLFQHQKRGVAWMLDRERLKSSALPPFYDEKSTTSGTKYLHSLTRHTYHSRPPSISGGMCADNMGMGKTLMVLAILLCHPPPTSSLVHLKEKLKIDLSDINSKQAHAVNVKASSGRNDARGKKKKKGRRVSFSSDEDSSSDNEGRPRKGVRVSGESASGPASETCRGISGSTLIVCPLSVLSSWQDQLSLHIRDNVVTSICYYGINRNKLHDETSLRQADVVLTTYDVLGSEVNIKKSLERNSPLQHIHWWRIVLDEGHVIRNLKTARTKACLALTARHKWYLTGTPVVNSVNDLEAPLRFLGLEPFASDHTLFARFITRPLRSGSIEDVARLRTLMKSFSIKREKVDMIDHILPPKVETIVHVTLNQQERAAYDGLEAAISHYTAYLESLTDDGGGLLANSQAVLALITRLRQCCLDTALVPTGAFVKLLAEAKGGAAATGLSHLSEEEKESLMVKLRGLFSAAGARQDAPGDPCAEDMGLECAVCYEVLLEETAIVFRVCRHTLCAICVTRLFANKSAVPCPLCRQAVRRDDCINYEDLKASSSEGLADDPVEAEGAIADDSKLVGSQSAKTKEVLRALSTIRSTAGGEKTVIFSAFLSYLDILYREITAAGFVVARIDGRLSRKKRCEEIRRFNNDDAVTVILCSMKAAGVGITLTRANNVFLTDLWWAPSVDLQAIDRVHRLGQTRPVNVLRFLVQNSIDERMYALQKRKIELSSLTFDRGTRDVQTQRLHELRSLLG